MASDKPKLSLRRKRKEAQPPEAVGSTHLAQPVGVVSEKVGGVSGAVSVERGELDDFQPQQPSRTGVGRKRRSPQNETAGYLDVVSEDQLQLALAVSASLQPSSALQTEHHRGRKRARQDRESVVVTSSKEREEIVAQRASEILSEAVVAREGVPSSSNQQQQKWSQLGRIVREGGSGSTLWEMAGYSEGETQSKFIVPALDLPGSSQSHSSPSPQSSPVAHAHRAQSPLSSHPHISHSPQRSPTHTPKPSPPSQSHISHSPHRPSSTHPHKLHSSPTAPPSHPHISHSPQRSPTHTPKPSPPLQSHISHSPPRPSSTHPHKLHSSPTAPPSHPHNPRPPPLSQGIKTLLSDLSSLVGSQLCSDVIITVADGRGIPAHSAILACRCPMLAERLFHSLDKPVRLNFSQHSRSSVVSFLRYLYTGSIPNTQDGMKAVKVLATSLGMMEPVDDREEKHPLVQTHSSSDSGRGVKVAPSQILAGRHGSGGTLTPAVLTPHQSPATETTPPLHEALPTSEDAATEDVISVSSSPVHQSPHLHQSPSSQRSLVTTSPLPLRDRLSSKPHPPVSVASSTVPRPHDKSHDQPSAVSNKQAATNSATPAATGQRPVLESDLEITPMPSYSDMNTPGLKGECSKYGVRALPKRKMIAKLREIYDYTHPLTDEDGNMVSMDGTAATDGKRGKEKGRKKDTASEKPSLEELAGKVREVITKDTRLYEDMLQYKPLELSYIQGRLKAAALPLSRDTLMDVLDHLCVTFSVPRQSQQQKTA